MEIGLENGELIKSNLKELIFEQSPNIITAAAVVTQTSGNSIDNKLSPRLEVFKNRKYCKNLWLPPFLIKTTDQIISSLSNLVKKQ